jgi:hypothetical protein
MSRSSTIYPEQLRLAAAWHKVKHLWWIRREPLGSVEPLNLCRKFGGHVRYANGRAASPIRIARFSATERAGYQPMIYREWLAMLLYGQFPLRRKALGPLAV